MKNRPREVQVSKMCRYMYVLMICANICCEPLSFASGASPVHQLRSQSATMFPSGEGLLDKQRIGSWM